MLITASMVIVAVTICFIPVFAIAVAVDNYNKPINKFKRKINNRRK